MGFRVIVAEAADLTTVRAVGRLRDDAVALLRDACDGARRPLVLDLSELTGASEAGVLLLARLRATGAHLLGASPYVRLLLDRVGTSPAGEGVHKETRARLGRARAGRRRTTGSR